MCEVSVLMPVYNAEKYLKEAIDSIINQTYKDWELVIVNDGSTDTTKNIIDSYADARIRYFENEKNCGVIKTLNKGIDYCKGKYIARMDADDMVHPYRLSNQVGFMESHPDYVLCGTDGVIINNGNKKVGKLNIIPFDEGIRIKLLFSNPFAHPSVMIRKTVLADNRYDESWKHVEDYELWTRLAEGGKVANLKKKYLTYRWHGENISQKQAITQANLKAKISKRELLKLGVEATDEDIRLHHLTFDNEVLNRSIVVGNNDFDGMNQWFQKLIDQNKIRKRYAHSYLVAFLWSRWILLCMKQGRRSKLFSASFVSLRPSILFNLFKFILAGIR